MCGGGGGVGCGEWLGEGVADLWFSASVEGFGGGEDFEVDEVGEDAVAFGGSEVEVAGEAAGDFSGGEGLGVFGVVFFEECCVDGGSDGDGAAGFGALVADVSAGEPVGGSSWCFVDVAEAVFGGDVADGFWGEEHAEAWVHVVDVFDEVFVAACSGEVGEDFDDAFVHGVGVFGEGFHGWGW